MADAPVVSVEKRQVIDLPEITVRVTEHQVEHRRCVCDRVTMAAIPTAMGAPVLLRPAAPLDRDLSAGRAVLAVGADQ